MSRCDRVDVAKCCDQFILIEDVGWYFLANYFAEQGFFCHIGSDRLPAGQCNRDPESLQLRKMCFVVSRVQS